MNNADWMNRALALAEKGRGWTSPNPIVGAVIVKDGCLVGEGWHREFGKEHAEVMALREAGKKANGATLFVTLEPCSSWGKTPPCLDPIIESKIKKVFIGFLDPNPLHAGKAVKKLRSKRIQVEVGLMERESMRQNESFTKWITQKMPFVTLKMAQSLDGKIASRTGSSRWISGPLARHYVHQLRSEHDAVMVGAGTFSLDNPRLSPIGIPRKLPPEKPWRIALASQAIRTSSNQLRIFEGTQRTLIIVSEKKADKVSKVFKNSKAFFLAVPEKKGKIDLKILLERLAKLGVSNLLVEGGGELSWSLLSEKLVDRLVWIVAPKIVGGRTAKTSVEGEGFKTPDDAFQFSFNRVRKLGEDLILEADLNNSSFAYKRK